MRVATVQGGKFKVSDEGYVWKLRNGKYVRATITRTGEKKQYRTVSIQENGKQVAFLLHRLFAEAFVPNPENKEQVMFKDGDHENLSIDNLIWVTPHERVKIAQSIKPTNYKKFKCKRCGEPTGCKDGMCVKCKREIHVQNSRARRIKQRKSQVKDAVVYNGSTRTEEIIKLRRDGLTYQGIADQVGLSRERVRQIIQKATERESDLKKLQTRIEKKRLQRKQLDFDIGILEQKIEFLKGCENHD